MRKHCSDVSKLRPCLNKESKNSVRLRTIVTAALQWQYSQTELIFWLSLLHQNFKTILKNSLRVVNHHMFLISNTVVEKKQCEVHHQC